MRPYYEQDGITIYHGDCREILPKLCVRADLLLTDPPYGIALDTDYSKRGQAVEGREYESVIGDDEPMDFRHLFDYGTIQIVFGANNWPQQVPFQPKRDGWLCWDKRTNEAADRIFGSPFELACVIGRRTYKIFRIQHCGIKNADGDRSGRLHPTQKPVALMAAILRQFPGETVLDPFCGSGTTLRAAKDLNRRAVGIEIKERYCEIAANRLAQGTLPIEFTA